MDFFFFFAIAWLRNKNFVSFIFPTMQNNESLIKLSVGKGMKRQSEVLNMVTNQRRGWTRKEGGLGGKQNAHILKLQAQKEKALW